MNLHTKARLIGFGILTTIVMSFMINMIYMGPIVFGDDFLNEIYANALQIKVSIFVQLASGMISLLIVILLVPIFLETNATLTYGYLTFGIIGFVVSLIDISQILSLYSISMEFTNSEMGDQLVLNTLGAVLYENRWWSHYLMLLIGALPLLFFYTLLLKSRLIPRWLSVWGLLAVPLLIYTLMMAMFDQGTNHNLMMPLGLNQLVLAGWLQIKGFAVTSDNSQKS